MEFHLRQHLVVALTVIWRIFHLQFHDWQLFVLFY